MKRMLSLCAAALCLTLALTPTALAADFEPAVPNAKVCYPAFQRQRGEGVSEIMEPNVLRADGFQNFVMGSAESVRVIHGSGLGRREHIRVARVLFALGNQQVDCLLRESQRPHGVACFRRTDHQFPVDSIYLLCDRKRFALHI